MGAIIGTDFIEDCQFYLEKWSIDASSLDISSEIFLFEGTQTDYNITYSAYEEQSEINCESIIEVPETVNSSFSQKLSEFVKKG